MSSHLIHTSSVVTAQMRNDLPKFTVGTVVSVHYKIVEGNKERVQVFTGIVIDTHEKTSLNATFTVLKNSTAGIKVERTFPLHSPMIEKIELVSKPQRARRAYLGFLHQVKDPIKTVRTKSIKSSPQA